MIPVNSDISTSFKESLVGSISCPFRPPLGYIRPSINQYQRPLIIPYPRILRKPKPKPPPVVSRMAPVQSAHYNWQVRAISIPGPDTDLALYVAFDNARYLFGCGEGTQRALVQKRVGSRWLGQIFICDGSLKGRGGLPGMAMTAADSGVSTVDVIGPPDITQYIATLRSSVARNILTVNTHCPPSSSSSSNIARKIYQTSTLDVRAVVLRPSRSLSSHPPSTFADLDVQSPDFRPARLPRDQVEVWAKAIVGDMFQNAGRYTKGRNLDPRVAMVPVPPDELVTEMVYICQAPPIPGKFDAARAVELEVPNGPLRGKLVKGETIEFEVNGEKRVVKPDDVVSGKAPGAVMIVVTCSAHNLETLLATREFDLYRPNRPLPEDAERVTVSLIIHRVPTDIWQDPEYQSWMTSFGPSTRHLIADTKTFRNDINFSASAWSTLRLSLLDNDIFPLQFCSTPQLPTPPQLPPNTFIIVTNQHVRLHPPGPIDIFPQVGKDITYPSDLDTALQARRNLVKNLPEYAFACAQARAAVRADPRWGKKEGYPGEDIMVTTLGTGSALPSKHRNVSSTHLDIPGFGGIILDAGEGTLGQLRRRFGFEGTKRVYQDLKMIFISHMHADHHLGLLAVLEDRFKQNITSPLYLIAPYPIAIQLQESGAWQLGASQEALDNIIWIDNFRLGKPALRNRDSMDTSPGTPGLQGEESESEEIMEAEDFTNGLRRWPRYDIIENTPETTAWHGRQTEMLKSDLKLVDIRLPDMRHRGRAWGLVVQHESGWKISYSGDTMPCDPFVRAGMGSTLMIHEATLEDDKPEVAREKGHSTFSQAIHIGRRMQARNILLNHFSQRYPKLPKLNTSNHESISGGADVSISFDLMSIKVGEMWKMKYYYEALELLFPPEEEVEEDAEVEGAVLGDVNATVDSGKGGKDKGKSEKKQGGGEKVKRKGKGKGNDAVKEVREDTREDVEMIQRSPTKRAVSPSSVDSETKRARADVQAE